VPGGIWAHFREGDTLLLRVLFSADLLHAWDSAFWRVVLSEYASSISAAPLREALVVYYAQKLRLESLNEKIESRKTQARMALMRKMRDSIDGSDLVAIYMLFLLVAKGSQVAEAIIHQGGCLAMHRHLIARQGGTLDTIPVFAACLFQDTSIWRHLDMDKWDAVPFNYEPPQLPTKISDGTGYQVMFRQLCGVPVGQEQALKDGIWEVLLGVEHLLTRYWAIWLEKQTGCLKSVLHPVAL